MAVAEAAEERQTPVALLIDELQYFSPKELSALIMAMHRMQQRQLPVVLLGAGLPILPRLAGESKSYAERLFSFPAIGALSEPDANKALQDPTKAAGVEFNADALKEIFRLTQGYPYFIQEWVMYRGIVLLTRPSACKSFRKPPRLRFNVWTRVFFASDLTD